MTRKSQMNRWTAWTLALLVGVAGPALAHEAKGGAAPAAPLKKEQKDWGIAGDAKAVTRTIQVELTDQMRFKPDRIAVKEGETVKFVVKNRGKMLHEMVLGTRQELDAHAAVMLKHPNMEHDEPYMTHVKAGGIGQIVWNFNRPGEFQFACLIAGHYQSGMAGTIQVTQKGE
ncbi:MAG TPA: cupredoxin family protein [Ramlibacter sp.]|nr:cupredoxin family protein [Ramlibacter sp.]